MTVGNANMSPFNGVYADSGGQLRDLFGNPAASPRRGMSPMNGNFYDGTGEIHNLDELGGEGTGGGGGQGPVGPQGPKGDTGAPGYSARYYSGAGPTSGTAQLQLNQITPAGVQAGDMIVCSNGQVMTVVSVDTVANAQWVASIVGPQGIQGEPGSPGSGGGSGWELIAAAQNTTGGLTYFGFDSLDGAVMSAYDEYELRVVTPYIPPNSGDPYANNSQPYLALIVNGYEQTTTGGFPPITMTRYIQNMLPQEMYETPNIPFKMLAGTVQELNLGSLDDPLVTSPLIPYRDCEYRVGISKVISMWRFDIELLSSNIEMTEDGVENGQAAYIYKSTGFYLKQEPISALQVRTASASQNAGNPISPPYVYMALYGKKNGLNAQPQPWPWEAQQK